MLCGVFIAMPMECSHFCLARCKRLYVVCQRPVEANIKGALSVKGGAFKKFECQLGFTRAGRGVNDVNVTVVLYPRHPRGQAVGQMGAAALNGVNLSAYIGHQVKFIRQKI